jgi:hypothetical protein
MTRRTSPRPARRRLAAPLGAALLGLASVLLIVIVVAGALPAARSGGVARAGREAPAPVPRAGAGAPPVAANRQPRPVRIEIAAIGVRARVVPLGLNADGTLQVPVDFDETGWWTGGARPGEPGPAVIAGHVDSYTGPAAFFRLGDLRAGDAIAVVRRDGSRVRFTVQRSAAYPKSRFPTDQVYGGTRGATLRLITCSGAFDRSSGHYLDNTVVFARRA